jgi:hypothetical protein
MERPTRSPEPDLRLGHLWRAHRGAIIASVATTVVLQAIIVWRVQPTPHAWLVHAFAAQFWLMVILVPWTAFAGRCALSLLARAGAAGDAFALALLFGVLDGRLHLWPAVKVFLLLEVVLLLLLGVFAGTRFASRSLLLAPVGTLLFGTLLALVTFVWPIYHALPGRWGVFDMHAAVCDAAWTTLDGVGWHRVLIVFACSAGVAWVVAIKLGMPSVATPIDDGRAAPP